MGRVSFFPFKEAHLSAYLLQGASSLRMSWALRGPGDFFPPLPDLEPLRVGSASQIQHTDAKEEPERRRCCVDQRQDRL